MTLTRLNSIGLKYELIELKEYETLISIPTLGKSIVVKSNVLDLSNQWYRWQMQGRYIQDAFPTLSADEREFLITGITPEEWDIMFKDDEE